MAAMKQAFGRHVMRSNRFAITAAAVSLLVLPGGIGEALAGKGGPAKQAPPAKVAPPAPAGGSHVGRPFGTVGIGRPFGSIGTGRPFAPLGTGRPFAPLGTGRAFGTGGGTAAAPETPAAPAPPVVPPRASVVLLPVEGEPLPPLPLVEEPLPVAPPQSLPADPQDAGGSAAEPSAPAPVPAALLDLGGRLVDRGRGQLRVGQPYLAEATLHSAVTLFPGDPELRLDHALALAGTGNVDGAAKQLVEAFRLDADLVRAPLNVVAAYGGKDRFVECVAVVERYVAAYPLDSHARFLLAFLLLHSGDAERARAEFGAIHAADPGFPFAAAFLDVLDDQERRSVALPRGADPPADHDGS